MTEGSSPSREAELESRCGELERELAAAQARARSLTAELAGRTHVVEQLQAKVESLEAAAPTPPPQHDAVLAVVERHASSPHARPPHQPRRRSRLTQLSRRVEAMLKETRRTRQRLRALEEEQRFAHDIEKRAEAAARQLKASGKARGLGPQEVDWLAREQEQRASRIRFLESELQKKADAVEKLHIKIESAEDARRDALTQLRALADERQVLSATVEQRERQIRASQEERDRLRAEVAAQQRGITAGSADPALVELEQARQREQSLSASLEQARQAERAAADQAERLQQELAELNLRVAQIERRAADEAARVGDADKKIAALEEAHQKKEQEREQLLTQLAEQSARLRTAQQELTTLRTRVGTGPLAPTTDERISHLEVALADAQRRANEGESAAQQARGLAVKAHEQAVRMQQALAGVQEELRTTEAQRLALEGRVGELEPLRLEIDTLRRRLASVEASRAGLAARLDQEDVRRASVMAELAQLQQGLAQARSELEQEQARRKEEAGQLARWEEQAALKQAELDVARMESSGHLAELEALKRSRVEQDQQHASLESERDLLSAQVVALSLEKDGMEAALGEVRERRDQLGAELAQHRERLEGQEAALKAALARTDEWRMAHARAAERLLELDHAQVRYQARVAELEAQLAQHHDDDPRLLEVELALDEKSAALEVAQHRRDRAQEEVQALRTENADLTARLEQAAGLRAQAEEAQRAALLASQQELARSGERAAALEQELAQVQAALSSLEQELAQVRAAASSLEQELAHSQERSAALEEELTQLRAAPPASPQAEGQTGGAPGEAALKAELAEARFQAAMVSQEMEQLRAQLTQVQDSRKMMGASLASAVSREEALTRQLAEARADAAMKLDELTREKEVLSSQLEQVRESRKLLGASLADAARREETLKAQLAAGAGGATPPMAGAVASTSQAAADPELVEKLAARERTLMEVRGQLAHLKLSVDELRAQVGAREQQLTGVQDLLRAREAQLAEVQGSLKALEKDRQQLDYLKAERTRLDEDLYKHREALHTATTELKGLRPLVAEVENLREDLRLIRVRLADAERERDTYLAFKVRVAQLEVEKTQLTREVRVREEALSQALEQDPLLQNMEGDLLTWRRPKETWYRPRRAAEPAPIDVDQLPEADGDALEGPPTAAAQLAGPDLFERLVAEGRRYRALSSEGGELEDAPGVAAAAGGGSSPAAAPRGRIIYSIDDAPEEGSEAFTRSSAEVADLQEIERLISSGATEEAASRARAVWRRRPDDDKALDLVIKSCAGATARLMDVLVELDERVSPRSLAPAQALALGRVLFDAGQFRDAAAYSLWAVGKSRKPLGDPLLDRAVASLAQLQKAKDVRALRSSSVLEGMQSLPPRALAPLFFLMEGYRVESAEGVISGARPGDLNVFVAGKSNKFGAYSPGASIPVFVRPISSMRGREEKVVVEEIVALFPSKVLQRQRLSVVLTPAAPDPLLAPELERIKRKESHTIVIISQGELVEAICRSQGQQLLADKVRK